MKNIIILIFVVAFIGISGYKIYFWAAPSVTIKNDGKENISQVIVKMAKNQLSFDMIAPGNSFTIYRGVRQVKTPYQYHITFESGEEKKGSCGEVQANEYFVEFVIRVLPDATIECVSYD